MAHTDPVLLQVHKIAGYSQPIRQSGLCALRGVPLDGVPLLRASDERLLLSNKELAARGAVAEKITGALQQGLFLPFTCVTYGKAALAFARYACAQWVGGTINHTFTR